MKKIFCRIVLVAVIFTFHLSHFTSARAQWGDYGVKAGLGYASITDDLSTKSPILGATVGAFANLTFTSSQTVLGEIFYLQTGLNLIRRGSNFQVILENTNTISIREGFYHAYYAQVPVLASVHLELPIRSAGHVVGFYAGPAFSFGLFGRCKDRMVSPYRSSYTVNYDLDVTGSAKDRAAFNHLRRFDISAIVGLSYEYHNLVFNFYVDHGFMATSKEDDILRIIENSQDGSADVKIEIPNGNNTAYMFSVGINLGNFQN